MEEQKKIASFWDMMLNNYYAYPFICLKFIHRMGIISGLGLEGVVAIDKSKNDMTE